MYLVSVSKVQIKSILYHFIHSQIINTFSCLLHPSITHLQCACAAFGLRPEVPRRNCVMITARLKTCCY